VKRLLFIIFTLGLAALPAGSLALSIDSSQDCDANAVINCGLTDTASANSAFQRSGVADIYSSFGINAQNMDNLTNTAVAGVVTDKNNVWIHRSSGLCPDVDTSSLSSQNQLAVKNNPNLCLVATDAMTAGRQFIPGSTRASSGSTTFYMRPPSVSFQSLSLPAFVVMSNGRFDFAIISSCGNPVKATPVVVPKVKAATTTAPIRPVQPAAPAPAQPQTQTQSQSQSQTVNVTQPAPAASPAPAPVANTVLPNTGPGSVAGLGGISAVLGTIGHLVYSRRRSVS
jgi:hypothetical protein